MEPDNAQLDARGPMIGVIVVLLILLIGTYFFVRSDLARLRAAREAALENGE